MNRPTDLTGAVDLWQNPASNRLYPGAPTMSAQRILQSIEKSQHRTASLPEFRAGDSIKVWAKIREGEKTRLQAFEGVCIRRVAKGSRSTFTVRKISYGVGVERIFPDNSPNIDKIEVIARGQVNQARLYYLRDLSGKAARIKEREGRDDESPAAEAAPVEVAPVEVAAPAPQRVKKPRKPDKKKEKKN
jgi:large subunit ribosomal protein L19